MTFDELLRARAWKPIRDCPGRYVLGGASRDLCPRELLGGGAETSEHRVAGAKDAVLITGLPGGGLISYRRDDGSYLHTLNTPEGFRRKLAQLGIDLT